MALELEGYLSEPEHLEGELSEMGHLEGDLSIPMVVGGGLSEEVKQALLDLFAHLAYTDADGQDYYDALYNAFYPPAELVSISAVYTQSGAVFEDTPLEDLEDDLVVTAHYSDGTTEEVTTYTLSGSLTAGTSVITVTYEDKTTTFNVTVSEPATLSSITAVYTQSGVVYPTDSLDSLKSDLVVTAHYSDSSTATVTTYTLSGTLTVGTSMITVTYSGKTTTFNVTVTAVPVLDSITAVYTQSGTVYDTDSLDSLKADLVVTAVYTDSSTEVVPSTDYTLSGTLTVGTSIITATYEGKTATFNVTVSQSAVNGWLYHFDQSLASSGTKDFGFTGTANYSTGFDGEGYSYHHVVATEGDSSTEVPAIVASGYTPPDLSGDFTISYWFKNQTANKGQGISAFRMTSTTGNYAGVSGSAANIASGWTVAKATINKTIFGLRMFWTGDKYQIRLVYSNNSKGSGFNVTPPSSFDSTLWHHYALTRKEGTIRFFVDGQVIFTLAESNTLAWVDQLSIAGYFDTVDSLHLGTNSFNMWYDDFYVAESCKWDSTFDPASITY